MSPTTGDRPHRGLRGVIVALGVTQITGWGTTYYLPAILAPDFTAATGLPGRFVFGGITVMLMIAGLLAPKAGRLLDRDGVRSWMVAGSGGIALGLLTLAVASGPVLFGLGWVLIGIATPFALSQAASTAIVEVAPEGHARRPLTMVLLFSGLASTAFWPVLISLHDAVGLRWSLVVYAGMHLFLCAPLHALVLPKRRPDAAPPPGAPGGTGLSAADAPSRRPVPAKIFWLTAITFPLSGFITWGLPLHAIAVLQDFGHARSTAVAIGSLLGPAQVLSRLIDIAGGHRVDVLTVALVAAAGMPAAILVLLMFGTEPVAAAIFAAIYGLSAGTLSLVRAVAPLRLFGRAAYATITGRLSRPQNIAYALAPAILAAIRESFSADALLLTVLASATLCLVTTVWLKVAVAPDGAAERA